MGVFRHVPEVAPTPGRFEVEFKSLLEVPTSFGECGPPGELIMLVPNPHHARFGEKHLGPLEFSDRHQGAGQRQKLDSSDGQALQPQ